MYYNKRKMLVSIFWIVIGAALLIAEFAGIIDNPIYAGMGGGWFAIGIMQLYRNVKYNSNDEYKEKIDVSYSDERNRYIRMKAWSFAGCIFVIGAAIVTIVLYIINEMEIAKIIGYSICVMLILYWGSYLLLQKKY